MKISTLQLLKTIMRAANLALEQVVDIEITPDDLFIIIQGGGRIRLEIAGFPEVVQLIIHKRGKRLLNSLRKLIKKAVTV